VGVGGDTFMRKTREVFEFFDINGGGTIESGTQFTCFTGTKEQMLTAVSAQTSWR
jgi:hypothetical protein